MNPLPLALLLDDNLLTASRVKSALEGRFRVKLSRALPAEMLETPQVAVINLGSRGIDGIALISACRERFPAARVVGFCGHREVEIRRAAKSAGIAKLFTNDEALSGLAGLETL